MSDVYGLTATNSLALRVGDNEWYIPHGGWGFNILTDTTVGIVNLPVCKENTIDLAVYVFEADIETIREFDCFADPSAFKEKCPQLNWKTLPPYVEPQHNDTDDDIAF